MNEKLQEIETQLADIQDSMTEWQGYWSGEGGDGLEEANTLWELAGAVSILAHVVHGLAKSLHAGKPEGGADD
jgi:uncharacterized protein YukE